MVGRLKTLFFQAAKMNKWFIHEAQIMPDHVHLLLQIPATLTVAKAVFYLKGGTSRAVRKEFPELEEFLWGDSLWQDGYFAETVGRQNEKAMREYIRNQWEQEPNTSRGL